MGTAAYGGRGFKGRAAVSGERPSSRRQLQTATQQVSCQSPPGAPSPKNLSLYPRLPIRQIYSTVMVLPPPQPQPLRLHLPLQQGGYGPRPVGQTPLTVASSGVGSATVVPSMPLLGEVFTLYFGGAGLTSNLQYFLVPETQSCESGLPGIPVDYVSAANATVQVGPPVLPVRAVLQLCC